MEELTKIIIVEGSSDKKKIKQLIVDEVEIICTNGTINVEKLDDMIEEYVLDERDVFILADADDSGDKLRKQFIREIPHAQILYIDKVYREVAAAPEQHLAQVLLSANIDIDPKYLLQNEGK